MEEQMRIRREKLAKWRAEKALGDSGNAGAAAKGTEPNLESTETSAMDTDQAQAAEKEKKMMPLPSLVKAGEYRGRLLCRRTRARSYGN